MPISPWVMLLPEELRLQILGFLTTEDLAEAAPVCRQLRNDCKHHSLPQLRTATITCSSGSPDSLLRLLCRMIEDGVFQRFQRLRIRRADRLGQIDDAYDMSGRLIHHVSYLDLSMSGSRTVSISSGVLDALQMLMPHANHLDLSRCQPPPVALVNCRNLQTLHWNHQRMNVPLLGITLPLSRDLKELYMDNSVFHVHRQSIVDRMQDDSQVNDDENTIHNDTWLFHKFGDKLERVSIKNCRYCLLWPPNDFGLRKVRPIPQAALIKFVRRSRSLRWFRSNLSSENIAMLQQEGSQVVFE